MEHHLCLTIFFFFYFLDTVDEISIHLCGGYFLNKICNEVSLLQISVLIFNFNFFLVRFRKRKQLFFFLSCLLMKIFEFKIFFYANSGGKPWLHNESTTVYNVRLVSWTLSNVNNDSYCPLGLGRSFSDYFFQANRADIDEYIGEENLSCTIRRVSLYINYGSCSHHQLISNLFFSIRSQEINFNALTLI